MWLALYGAMEQHVTTEQQVMTEQEALAVWLRKRGVSEHDVKVYRRALKAVRNVVPSEVIGASQMNNVLEVERIHGATRQRLDNLAYIGEKLVRFCSEIDSTQLIKDQPLDLALKPEPEPRTARGTPAAPVTPAISPITGKPLQVIMPKLEPPRSRRATPPDAIPKQENRGNCTCLAGTKDTRVEEGPDAVSRDLLAMIGIACVGLGALKGIAVLLGIAAGCAVVGYGIYRRLQGVKFVCLRCHEVIPPENPFEEAKIAEIATKLKLRLGLLGIVAIATASTYLWMINHTARAVSG